jgi:hypothetical protein
MTVKKSNLKIAALAAVAVVGVTLFTIPVVSAYRGDNTKQGPNYTPAREAAMETALKAKDFTAWKKLMVEDGRQPGVLRIVDTQVEFNKFADAWALAEQGKTTEAAKLRAELGLGQGNGSGNGNGAGRNGARGQNNGGKFVDANKNGTCDMME